jgi:putative oxidoreductase
MELLNILGRIIFGGYFIYSAFNHFIFMKMMIGYSQSKKIPMANVAVPITGLMLLAGGLSFLLDLHVTLGSLILIAFLLPTSLLMHNFWSISDPMQKMGEQVNFTKNIALIGALLLFIYARQLTGVPL